MMCDQGEPGQTGSSFLSGIINPSDDLGNDGDSYLNYSTWDFFVKENGTWVLKGNMQPTIPEDNRPYVSVSFEECDYEIDGIRYHHTGEDGDHTIYVKVGTEVTFYPTKEYYEFEYAEVYYPYGIKSRTLDYIQHCLYLNCLNNPLLSHKIFLACY